MFISMHIKCIEDMKFSFIQIWDQALTSMLEAQALFKALILKVLNRFDAVSAYMRKIDHYGLSDF